MKLKMDKAGRIVLPKPVRERLGLRAGMDLEVSHGPEGLVLRPIMPRPSLVRVGRFLVHTGQFPPGEGILKAITHGRQERTRRLAGL